MPKMNELRLGYTASPRYAFVYNAHHFENINNYQDHTLGMNFLLKRGFNLTLKQICMQVLTLDTLKTIKMKEKLGISFNG